MLFEISAETRGGLRVIPTIPNISRCWLEGRNGIGKTVAVRLLELMAGKQPFSGDPDGWTALRENLGPTTITISEFPKTASIQSIQVSLTPQEWPDHPALLTTELGAIVIDGELRDHTALRELVDVIRIGGDETVISQLRTLVGTDHALAVRCRAWLEDIAQDVGDILTPLIIDVDKLSESEFISARHAVQEARQQVAVSETKMMAISQRQRDLQDLIELSELREQQRLLGPRVQVELAESIARVRELTTLKDDLTHQLRALVPKRAVSQQLQSELEELQGLRDGRIARAARTGTTARQALKEVELDEDTIGLALEDALERRDRLRKERSTLDTLPALLDTIDAIRIPLAEIEASSLDAEIVAVLEGSQRISASGLRLGLDSRTDELKLDVAYNTLAELDHEIQDGNDHIKRLYAAEAQVRDAARKAALLLDVESRIQQISQQLRDSTGDEYSRISDELRAIEYELTEAIKQEVELKVHLDLLNRSGGTEVLDNKIRDLRRKLDVSIDEVHSELDDAIDLQHNLSAAHQQHRLELGGYERELNALEEQLVRAVQLVTRGRDYQWLRERIAADNLPTARSDRNAALRQLSYLAQAARDVQSRVETSLNEIATVQGALDSVRQSIAMHRDPSRNRFVNNLISRYEQQMAEYLSNEDIREGIFGGGDFQRFDLMNGFVVWRTAAGEVRRRPIEAFSSGERAFAYMLAAILSHRQSSAQFRVFILDEFGAFVEHSRRSRLWHFLDERLLKTGVAAQVVVILPSQSSSPTDAQTAQFIADEYFAEEARL